MGSPATDRELVRRGGLKAFAKLAWRHIPAQNGDPTWEPHMDLVCDHYEGVLRGEIKDLVVNVPPGMSKSVLTNILLMAFDWGPNKCPWRKWIYTAYAEDLALRDAGYCMDLIAGEWYQARWGDVVGVIDGGEKAAKRYYGNPKGGTRFTTMLGGAATGFHGHILVCDDPVKPADIQAGGDPAREKLEKCATRWDQTFSSRSSDAATFCKILIMQRLHHLDLAGVMIRRGAQALVLPMEFESSRKYESPWGSDWRTEEGELLSPKRFPRAVVEERKALNSARDYAAQYQQRPSPEDGSIFLKEFFERRWIALPRMSRMLISVDATFKGSKTSDFFVCQVWGMRTATEFYLIDQKKQRTGFHGGIEIIKSMRKAWPQVSTVLIEDKANGSAIIETLRKEMTGVVAITPRGGKESRANAAEPIYRSNCYFPSDGQAPWMESYIDSHLSFPVGSYDDEVDCSTQAVLELQSKTSYALRKKAMENARQGRTFR